MKKIKSNFEIKIAGAFTSFIDIIFLLLLFFMLQPFKAPDYRTRVYLPKKGSVIDEVKQDSIIRPQIQLRIEGSKDSPEFVINGEVVKRKFIVSRLLAICGGDIKTPVVISSSPSVYADHVIYVLDQCAIADMRKISFASEL
jgi:biopolymer transport protein ExbD